MSIWPLIRCLKEFIGVNMSSHLNTLAYGWNLQPSFINILSLKWSLNDSHSQKSDCNPPLIYWESEMAIKWFALPNKWLQPSTNILSMKWSLNDSHSQTSDKPTKVSLDLMDWCNLWSSWPLIKFLMPYKVQVNLTWALVVCELYGMLYET